MEDESTMTRYNARVEVKLKPGYLDPEGETTKQTLNDLKFSVSKTSVAKVYEIELEAEDQKTAEKLTEEMCKRLLANPVKDDYSYEVKESK